MDKVLFLLLPEGATDLEVCPQWDDEVGPFYLHFYVDGEGDYRDIPEGYTLLGLSTDILKNEQLAEKALGDTDLWSGLRLHMTATQMREEPFRILFKEYMLSKSLNPSQPYAVLGKLD